MAAVATVHMWQSLKWQTVWQTNCCVVCDYAAAVKQHDGNYKLPLAVMPDVKTISLCPNRRRSLLMFDHCCGMPNWCPCHQHSLAKCQWFRMTVCMSVWPIECRVRQLVWLSVDKRRHSLQYTEQNIICQSIIVVDCDQNALERVCTHNITAHSLPNWIELSGCRLTNRCVWCSWNVPVCPNIKTID